MVCVGDDHRRSKGGDTHSGDGAPGCGGAQLGRELRERSPPLILTHLHGGAYLEVKELAGALDVDSSTIRRDLQELTRIGKVQRLHGGVRLPPAASEGAPLRAVSLRRAHIAIAIASRARSLLQPGSSIVLGAGPIADLLAAQLLDLPDIEVTTNSLTVAQFLSPHSNVTIRMCGGELRTGSTELAGPGAVHYFEQRRADWVMLEVDGIHPYGGLTISTPTSVATRRAMLGCADRRCILVPSSHFGTRTVGFVADVASVDLFITDEGLDDSELPAFGGRVARAAVPSDEDWRIDTDRYVP